MTIQPMPKRILAEMLSVYDGQPNPLNLTLVDKRKHFDHPSRKARVMAVGRGVTEVKVGDVVVIRGSAGFTLDHEPVEEAPGKGESYRWLYEKDCLALEVPS